MPGGDCGTARRVVQGALKLILEPIFKLLFKRGRMDIDSGSLRVWGIRSIQPPLPNYFILRVSPYWSRNAAL
jgi:hypothetical protein